MPFYERLGGQDAVMLTRICAALSLMLTDKKGFSYNFSMMLFGIIAYELTSVGPEQFFLTLVLFSGIFDIFSLMASTRTPTTIVALAVTVLKAPIYVSGLGRLRERGGELEWASRGFGGGFGGWMPGSSQGQTLGSDGPAPPGAPAAAPVPAPGNFPSGGFRLGGDERTTRDGYTSIA